MLRIHCVGLIVAMVVQAFWPAPLTASQELRNKLASLAKDILANTKNQPVTIGQFTPTGLPDTNSGAGIEQILATELERIAKGSVRADAPFEVKGDYALLQSREDTALKEIKILARIIEKKTGEEVLRRVEARVRGTQSIAEIVQKTIALPPLGDRETRNKKIQERIEQPQVHLDGSRIAAKEGRPFAVELLVKSRADQPATPRAPRLEGGQAFVDIRRNEIYEMRVHNQTRHEAAVTLTIDGLDVFTFSEVRDPKTSRPRYSHFIVGPGKSATIVGWHKTNERADSFLVTEYGKGASALVPQQARGKVGVITVTFALAWEGNNVPEDEKGSRDGGNETGFGPPRKTDLKEVQRHIGTVRDIVAIRYTR